MITRTKRHRTGFFPICLVWILIFSQPGFSNYYESNTKREAALLAGGVAVTLLGTYFSSHVRPPDLSTLDPNEVPFYDRFAIRFQNKALADVSNGLAASCILMPFAVSVSHSKYRETDALMIAESFLYTYGITSLCKGLFHRVRPYVYRSEEEPTRMSGYASRSFFSRHTSMAFQGAVLAGMIYQTTHPGSRGVFPVWAAGLTCATATGVFRVLSGNHFPTDVLAGAAVGVLVGWGIPRLHEKAESEKNVPVSPSPQYVFQVKFNF